MAGQARSPFVITEHIPSYHTDLAGHGSLIFVATSGCVYVYVCVCVCECVCVHERGGMCAYIVLGARLYMTFSL